MFASFGIKKLLEKLQRKPYREAYLSEHTRRGLAYQIRALRDQRGWKQGRLAAELDKPQSVVCRLEDPAYGKVTLQTLLEVAAAFDVALQVRFVSFSSFVQNTRDLTSTAMEVSSFTDDVGMLPEIQHSGEGVSVIRTSKSETTEVGFADDVGFALDVLSPHMISAQRMATGYVN